MGTIQGVHRRHRAKELGRTTPQRVQIDPANTQFKTTSSRVFRDTRVALLANGLGDIVYSKISNQTRVDPTYLALQLAQNRLAAYFGQQAVGSTRYGLSVAAIANAPILLPRIEEQREAGKLIRLQDAHIHQHEAELKKLTSIKSGLMTDLLTGRIRVPETVGTTP